MPSPNKQNNLQDIFLKKLRETKALVTLFLVNGVRLQGSVTEFDNFSLLLYREGSLQLIYKHAISTMLPLETLLLFEGEKEAHSQD